MLLMLFIFLICILLIHLTDNNESSSENNDVVENSSSQSSIQHLHANKKQKELSLQSSLIILFLCIIALVAEVALFTLFGTAASLSNPATGARIMMVGSFLLLYTILIGVASLVSLLLAAVSNNNAAGYKVLKNTIVWGFIVLFVIGSVSFIASGKHSKDADKIATEEDSTIPKGDSKLGYLEKLEVRNIKISQDWSGNDGVFGDIKNHGDKTLTKVEITVYALDSNGMAVFEKTFNPVLVSSYSFNNEGPLKPNYSRSFGYRMDGAPSEWAKKVDIKITDIEFEEENQL